MSTETLQEMENILKLQKKLHIEEGPASIELRKDRLNRCIKMVKEYSDEIIELHCLDHDKCGIRNLLLNT